MKAQIQTDAANDAERLSEWIDGEADPRANEPLVGELVRSRDWHARYREWHFVGDALRSDEVAAAHCTALCERICAAIEREPAIVAPRALAPRWQRHFASGVAVAAAAAVIVFVAVPQLRGPAPRSGTDLARSAPPAASLAEVTALPQAGAQVPANSRLEPYFMAHRDVAPGGVMPAAAVYLRFGNDQPEH